MKWSCYDLKTTRVTRGDKLVFCAWNFENNTNKLVSGDNKGYASYLFEKAKNQKNVLPGQGEFVAAFASTNLGDVSPNINGTYCMDTGYLASPCIARVTVKTKCALVEDRESTCLIQPGSLGRGNTRRQANFTNLRRR